jgi:hypothetical protein
MTPDIRYKLLMTIQDDGRFAFLVHARKLKIIEDAINTVWDGKKPPKRIWEKDPETGKGDLGELWTKLVRVARSEKMRGG